MSNSIVVRMSLGLELRKMRLAANKRAADVETAGVGKRGKLNNIEAGRVAPSIPDVESLCRLYGADHATTTRLVDLTRAAARGGGWWERYGGTLPGWFNTYVQLESAAESLWAYHGELIPGLLQTTAYHRALFDADTEQDVKAQLAVRAARQQHAFERNRPLNLTAVLGHGALTRTFGAGDVMSEQLRHLLTMDERETLEILVVPPDARYHPGMKSPFNILEFAGPVPPLVYTETAYGGRYEDSTGLTESYCRAATVIRARAVRVKEYLG